MSVSQVAIRQSLEALLAEVASHAASECGYAVTAISFAEAVEATLEKAGMTFVLWLRPVNDGSAYYKQTTSFKIGYRGEPPDRSGYALLDAMCTGIERWERSLAVGAAAQLFERLSLALAADDASSLDPATRALLADANFSSIYRDWLPTRQRRLAERLSQLAPVTTRILLVNATKGLQFYSSVVDFFAVVQRIHHGVRVTSASYFDDVFQFHQGAAEKGLEPAPIAEVMSWGVAEVNRFDVVMLVGPSEVMARFMTLQGLTAKLVLLDLAFFHQVQPKFMRVEDIIDDKSSQRNRVVVYSCQPEAKATRDLARMCSLALLEWHWFNYIPIGFDYCRYYRCDRRAFDVGLLGSAGRDYAQIDPAQFRGLRLLFVGEVNVPEIDRLLAALDVTVVSRVDESSYARLVALCRCVIFPARVHHLVNNVFMSVLDVVASGKPLVVPRHTGLARLERDGVPAVFYDHTDRHDLAGRVNDLVRQPERIEEIETRSIAFAKENLDIYRILEMILEEQVL